MTRAAIVILNYNGRKYLKKFLPSVVTYSSGQPIYVIDNGSTDNSSTFVKSNYPTIHLLQFGENKGFAGGDNEALKQITADIYVLVNNDIEVTSSWLEPILQQMEDDPSIAACQPKLLSYHRKSTFEYAGAAGGFIDFLGFPFCIGRLFQEMEEDHGQYDDITRIFWASGACLFIRSDIFHHLGGFDIDFFAHMEEVDLCWRIQNAGYKVYYNGNSKVYHVGGGTLSKSNPRKTYLNFRNGLSMFVKNEVQGKLWWKIPLRSCFDFIAFLKFSIFDTLPDGFAVLKAHFFFWIKLPHALKKRKHAKKNWLNPRIRIVFIYNNSIVLDYFLRRKKKFMELHPHFLKKIRFGNKFQ